MASADAEIEGLKAAVSRHFSVYGVVVTPLALTFQVTAPDGFDRPFDALRKELVPQNYIPTITQERGETLVHVQRRPAPRFARREVNVALLGLTVITTVFFGGAFNWAEYAGTPLLSIESIGLGALFFGIPLLTILGAHEMGHYLVAKRYHVHASLPFFLPSFPPLGTFGAFISMRDPIPNRKALLDIGVSGPLVGFALAIPLTIAGLALSAANPVLPPTEPMEGAQAIHGSLLFNFLSWFFPLPTDYVLHPLAFAGWVGLFVTAINLLPAGQLDGGHVARALLGRNQHYLSWAAILALFAMSTMYFGWVIFGFLILMLGVRHPPPLNDLTRLDPVRQLVGVAAVAILVLTFIPQPFVITSAQRSLAFETLAGTALPSLETDVSVGKTVILSFVVNTTGGFREQIGLRVDPRNLDVLGWSILFRDVRVTDGTRDRTTSVNADNVTVAVNATEWAVVDLEVSVPSGFSPVPSSPQFVVDGRLEGDILRHLTVTINVA